MFTTEFDLLGNTKDLGIELLVIGVAFYLIEKIRPAERKIPFFKDDFSKEFGFAALNALLFIPLYAIVITFIFSSYASHLLPYQVFDAQLSALPIVAQMFAGALLMDLSTYWRHRFTHYAMWPYHSVHHSARHLNWLTSLRLHPVDVLIATLFDMSVLYIFGFSGEGIIFAAIFMRLYNYFTHANINLQFDKPMRYIFASPNFHRWHHDTSESSYNKNFCAMFSFLDLVFGTYHHPEGELPKAYGLSPADQKEYPEKLSEQLLYPFKREFKRFRKNK